MSTTLDPATQLALMAKANRVFADADTFLSFPLTPLVLNRRDLTFSLTGNADAVRRSQRALREFSTLVNRLPSGEAWEFADGQLLWDAYDQLLRDAELAESTRTREEERRYQDALALLRDEGVSAAYEQCRDAHASAQQLYVADRSSAELSDDPDARQRWQATESERRAELDALLLDWLVRGHKDAVESARSAVSQLSAKSPLTTWDTWRGAFSLDIDGMIDPSQGSLVFPTFFSPDNALADGSWSPFELGAREIAALVAQAPAEVRARLDAASGSSPPNTLRFEFSSALLVRSWFDEETLRARFWRLPRGREPISDGKAPARGTCPAYTTGVVFARRIVATPTGAAPKSATPAGATPKSAAPSGPSPPRALPLSFDRATAQASKASITPLQARVEPLSILRGLPSGTTRGAPTLLRPPVQTVLRAPRAVPTPPALAGAAPPGVRSGTDDAIHVLAFICRAVSRCPNPDPTLRWP